MPSPPPLPSSSQQHKDLQSTTELPRNRKLTIFLLTLIGSLSVLTIFTLVTTVIVVVSNTAQTPITNDVEKEDHAQSSHDSQTAAAPETAESSRDQHAAHDPGTGTPSTDPTSTDPTSTDPTSTDPTSTDPTSTDPTSTHPTSTDPTSTDPTSTDPTSTDPTSTDPTSTDPTSTDPTSTNPPSKAGAPPIQSSYTIPSLESHQLISDWLSDPLSIFCKVDLESDWIPDTEAFFAKTELEVERERMSQSPRTFPEAWLGIRTCRLNLAAYNAPDTNRTLPIATSNFEAMDAAITIDQDSHELYMKLRWRKDPSKVTTKLMPVLARKWREHEKSTKIKRKLLSTLIILNATSYGQALRTNILNNFDTSANDLSTPGSKKVADLETLRLSLSAFEERTLREAQTRISECNYKIRLATTITRIFYPGLNGGGDWESLESWQGRIIAAQRPFIATRMECQRVQNSAPNDILRIESLIEEQCLAIRELQRTSDQVVQRSPLRLTLPYTIEWSTSKGAIAVLPLVVECHFK